MSRYYVSILVMHGDRLVAQYREAHWTWEEAMAAKKKAKQIAWTKGHTCTVEVTRQTFLN